MYGPPVNGNIIKTPASRTGAEANWKIAKPRQPSTDRRRKYMNTIAAIINTPESAMRIKCPFPRQVTGAPMQAGADRRRFIHMYLLFLLSTLD